MVYAVYVFAYDQFRTVLVVLMFSITVQVVRRIRAVVALPNRDLVGQVRAVFETYINAYG